MLKGGRGRFASEHRDTRRVSLPTRNHERMTFSERLDEGTAARFGSTPSALRISARHRGLFFHAAQCASVNPTVSPQNPHHARASVSSAKRCGERRGRWCGDRQYGIARKKHKRVTSRRLVLISCPHGSLEPCCLKARISTRPTSGVVADGLENLVPRHGRLAVPRRRAPPRNASGP